MKRKLLSILLCLAMALSLLPTAALADGATGTGTIKVGNESHGSFSEAVDAATPDESGVITYEISGKVDVTATGWVQVAKADLTSLSKVAFVGITDDAEICITGDLAILADQKYDIDVSFTNLKLSKPNPTYGGDYGHSTNYFTCWLRNTNAGENTVTYTDCTFPDGACNNQYGKTVFDNCKFTNRTSGMYNLWNYGGNTEIKNSEFTGTRGIKAYSEGTDGGDITVADTTFTSLTEKAAIIASKPVGIVVEDISVSGNKGFITRDITGNDEVELNVSGTGISGNFNITSNTDAAAAKSEFNITAGTFTGTLDTDYLAPGATINESGTVEMNPVAKVGTTEYTTLEAAFAELNANNYTLELLVDNAWDAATPVYWKAGTQSGYAATLKAALTAAQTGTDSVLIVCRPGATVTASNDGVHYDVTNNLTIYANNADFSGKDLSIGTYAAPKNSETTINIYIYDAKNLVVWGQPVGDRADVWNVNFTDCVNDGSNFLMYRGRENGKATINATLTGCKATGFDDSIIHTTADGRITIKNCEFANNCAPVNIAHKQAGEMTVTVENSTFTNCGETDTTKDLYRYAAPVRIVNNNAAGTVATEVTNCTFADTVGNNGDILIGDGRDGKESKDVSLTVKNTAANVQAQKPGYYNGANTDDSKKKELPLTAADSLNTTIADLLPVTKVDLDEFIKLVTSAGYSFDGSSVAGTGKKLTVKWNPVSGCFELAKGSGNHSPKVTCPGSAATGNTPNRINSDLAQYQLFKSATDVTIKNVNFVYESADFTVCANSGWAGSGTADGVKSAQLQLETTGAGDVTIEGCSFDHVVFTSWQNSGKTVIKNSAFKNIYGSYAIKDLGGSSVEVSDCTFENCGGGIMLDSNNGRTVTPATVTISGNTFTNVDVAGTAPENKVGTRALIQFPSKGDYTEAKLILDGNTASNCGPILRQLNKGIADNDVLSNNLKGDLTGLGGGLTFTDDSETKEGAEKPAQPTIYTVKFSGSDVADKKVVSGTTIDLPTAAKSGYTFNGWYDGSTKVSSPYKVTKDVTLTASWSYNYSGGSSSYDPTYSVSTPSKTENGGVTVSPKNASKGDTVTVTVKPDSGYVLETLTVTDKNGNELTLKDKGNGKYTFTMPAGKVEVKATFMEDNSMLNFFYDVPNDAYFYEAVKWAVENGITTGVGNDLFAPEQPCTRAQIVTFLWRAAGSPEPKGAASGMTDVVSGSYYEKAVAWAIENGITTGTTTSTFSPDATCTRAQAVTFLARAMNAKAASAAEFSDVPTGSYFADAVAWAAANGVTEGIGGGLFGSDNDCTRGQIVTFLYRAYNK